MQNTNILELKWGTPTPYTISDSRYGDIKILISGICHYMINNQNTNTDHILDELTKKIIACVLGEVGQLDNKDFEVLQIETSHPEFSKRLTARFMSIYQNSNIIVKEINVTNISMTNESIQKVEAIRQKEIEEKTVGPTVIQTNGDVENGQNKCPKCGSTEISMNPKNGHLRCHFCRTEFEPEKVVGFETNINQLEGQVLGSGAQDIIADTNDILTFKCSSCGAEVVIDTSEAAQARCHWCRNTLSINQQIPNGSIPDVVLPFKVQKEEARAEIEKFVGKRKFFAHPKFKEEFTTHNIMGVYFPYMIVDINAHANLVGQGEHLVRKYYRGSGDNRETYYDADLYNVEREFDVIIEGLTVESSADKLNKNAANKTTNVINSIMPFDIENSVKWNANYLRGYSSEKRDTNIEQLKPLVEVQSKDITRFAANETLKHYDRGVAWSSEELSIKGQQWKAAYLPVWLYSYQQVKGNQKMLHYVAVNARTKETMGSVPIHMPKLLAISALVELLGILLMIFVEFEYNIVFLLSGIVYFFIMYSKYRNSNARHKHELETKKKMGNLRQVDRLVKRKTGMTNAVMTGANNTSVSSQSFGGQMLDSLAKKNIVANVIKNNIDKGGN